MSYLIAIARHHSRHFALLAMAAAMFGLWFGVWLRVLPLKPRPVIRLPDECGLLGFASDSRAVITAQGEGGAVSEWRIQFWDAATGEVLKTFEPGEFQYLGGGGGGFTSNCCLSDFVLIDPKKNPQLCAFLDSRIRITLNSLPGNYISHDKRTVALDCREKLTSPPRLSVWNVEADRQRFVLDNSAYGTACFSPDDRALAYVQNAGQRFQVTVVDAKTGEVRQLLEPCESVPGQMQFSPNGNLLAAASGSHIVIWELETRKQTRRIEAQDFRDPLCFSSDGRYLATMYSPDRSETAIRIWNTADWQAHFMPPPRQDGDTFPGVPVPNSALIVFRHAYRTEPSAMHGLKQSVGPDEDPEVVEKESLTVFDIESGRHSKPICDGSAGWFAVSPDGQALAVQCGKELHLYDLPPRRPLALMLAMSAVSTFLFSGLVWWRWGRRN